MRYSFGLGECSLDHHRREGFPAIFTIVDVGEEKDSFIEFIF